MFLPVGTGLAGSLHHPQEPMSPLLEVPLVVIGRRDAGWLSDVLADLIASHYFERRGLPALGVRAQVVVDSLAVVAGRSGQREDGREVAGHSAFISCKEAAAMLNVSTRTIRRRIGDGTIPATRLG